MHRPPARESVSNEVIPPRPVKEIAAETIVDLDHTLARLAAFGAKVRADSRLHQSRAVLVDATATGRLAPIQRGDSVGLRALEVALDFHDIAIALPSTRNTVLRKDLEQAAHGSLEPPETGRGPLQIQSQLIVWAAFSRAGAGPLLPAARGAGVPNPDVMLENGLTTYGVEVKRPQVARNIIPRFLEGVEQIRGSGSPGGVIVDVTDCLRGLNGSAFDDTVRGHALDLYDQIWTEGRSYQPGFSHIMFIGAIARPAWSSIDGPDAGMVQVHFSSTVGVFATHPNNLAAHRARWLRSTLQAGPRRLGKTSAESA